MSSLSEVITVSLTAIGASLLTDLFIVLLFGIFSAGIWLRLRNQAAAFTQYVPTLLTIIGILGTFSGILVGLLAFNIEKIDLSIGGLLAGLKTAFIASLIGIFLSVIYKSLVTTNVLRPLKAFAPADDSVKTEDIEDVLQAQLVAQQQQILLAQEQLEMIKQLNHRLQGFELRLEDRLSYLTSELSSAATDQMISAIEKIAMNFNAHISHQFGEQFAQLSESVRVLAAWQDEHQAQVVTEVSQVMNAHQHALEGQLGHVAHTIHCQIEQMMNEIGRSVKQLSSAITPLAPHHDATRPAVCQVPGVVTDPAQVPIPLKMSINTKYHSE
jgi:hypothetical protein